MQNFLIFPLTIFSLSFQSYICHASVEFLWTAACLPAFYSHCGNVSYSQYAIAECKNATTHTFDRFNAILNLILPRNSNNNMNTSYHSAMVCLPHKNHSLLWLHFYGLSSAAAGVGRNLFAFKKVLHTMIISNRYDELISFLIRPFSTTPKIHCKATELTIDGAHGFATAYIAFINWKTQFTRFFALPSISRKMIARAAAAAATALVALFCTRW